VQDRLYLKVESHNISNFTRGSWKRSIKLFGKVSCRHAGCSVESKTFEETLGHYFSCPMAPKKVNITQGLGLRQSPLMPNTCQVQG